MDPELAEIHVTLVRSDLSDVTEARERLRVLVESSAPAAVTRAVSVRDTVVPGRDPGIGVPVRIYAPVEPPGGPMGILLMIHGGAFVLGDLETEHDRCMRYSEQVPCVVVSVDYRLAPEHPFPAGLHDCAGALEWTATNAATLGGRADRVAVGGTSAGAGMAASLALLARDEGRPSLCHQLLIYPVLDDRLTTGSMRRFLEMAPWDATASQLMWVHYLGVTRGNVTPYAAAARSDRLGGLPPTYIAAAELDPLRDEAIEYGWRLIEAGVPTELHHFPGTFHGFDLVGSSTGIGARALDEQVAVLRRHLGQVPADVAG